MKAISSFLCFKSTGFESPWSLRKGALAPYVAIEVENEGGLPGLAKSEKRGRKKNGEALRLWGHQLSRSRVEGNPGRGVEEFDVTFNATPSDSVFATTSSPYSKQRRKRSNLRKTTL